MDLDRATCGDACELAEHLPAGSVNLIFTDPPYSHDAVQLYGLAAEIGARALRPGGWLLAMGGGCYADEILAQMAAHLTYHWTLHTYLAGQGNPLRPHGQNAPVVTRVKPIYVFAKGRTMPRTVVYDPFAGDGNDKRFHDWGQDAKSARYYIDCFSREDDVVLDPFCGGGTTVAVCVALRRHWLAWDIDPVAVETTRARARNPLYVPVRDGQLVFDFAK